MGDKATARERWLRRLVGDEKADVIAAFRKRLRELGIALDDAGVERKEGKNMAGKARKSWRLNKGKKQDGSEMTIEDVPPEVVAALPEEASEEIAILATDIGETVAAAVEGGTEPTMEAVAEVVAEKLGEVLEEVPAEGEPTTPEEEAVEEINAALAETGKALKAAAPELAALIAAQAEDNARLAVNNAELMATAKEMRAANEKLAADIKALLKARPRQASKDADTTLDNDTEIDGKTLEEIGKAFAKGLQTKESTFLGLPVTHKPA